MLIQEQFQKFVDLNLKIFEQPYLNPFQCKKMLLNIKKVVTMPVVS